jgi:hypothetical protein
MATGDISRNAFDPAKHYAGVRMQQGRVIVDDDWNDNERIGNEDRRSARTDIIGPAGTPDNGFRIYDPVIKDNNINFKIGAGSFYLGGLPLEMEETEYYTQEDWLAQPDNLDNVPGDTRFDLVYLEAWQQPVSAVEDGELFEVALGGPDTSTRVRNMRRVRVETDIGKVDCEKAREILGERWKQQNKGTLNQQNERVPDVKLSVSFTGDGDPQDPCKPNVQGGYLGAENQALRVQLVDENHLTWGFDNASPLYRVRVAGQQVTMVTEPKDQAHWPLAGQVVEILPRSALLSNGEKTAEIQGELFKVETSYNPDDGALTLDAPLDPNFGEEWQETGGIVSVVSPAYLFMRVWNRGQDLSSDAKIPFTAGTAVTLGFTGLAVTITGDDLVPGDYWIIAARPETPNKVVPWKLEQGKAPNGIHRFYAPLAIICWQNINREMQGRVIHDCRIIFPNLTHLKASDILFENRYCKIQTTEKVTVQDALDFLCRRPKWCTLVALPGKGWEKIFDEIKENQSAQVCLQVGTYYLDSAVHLKNKGNIKMTGCGKGTKIIVKNSEAAFIFENCQEVIIRDLYTESRVVGSKGKREHLNGTITFIECDEVNLERVSVKNGSGSRKAAACITVRNSASSVKANKIKGTVNIQNSSFTVGHHQVGILLVNADTAYIENNTISVGKKPKKVTFDKLVEDNFYKGLVRRSMISGIFVDKTPPEGSESKEKIKVFEHEVYFKTEKNLAGKWSDVAELIPQENIKTAGDVKVELLKVVDQIITNKGEFRDLVAFKHWYKDLSIQNPAVAAQGIVVGGEIVRELRIFNNTIRGVLQGIHLGLSHREQQRGVPDIAGTTIISGNTIIVTLPPVVTKERFGIFIGNCKSAVIENNYLEAVFRMLQKWEKPYVEGIRVYGHLGKRMIILQNHQEKFSLGIYINPLNWESISLPLWLVKDNVASVYVPAEKRAKVKQSRNYG